MVKKTTPLKVLQVVHALGMGGAETWLMEVLRLWAKSGAGQIHFLCTSGGPGVFDEEARRLGAMIYYVPYGRAHLLRFARKFRNILRAEKYDAIHDHADYASGWHFLLGIGVLPRVRITHVHNPWLHIAVNYSVSPTRRLAASLGKLLVRLLATHVSGTSAEILRQYGFVQKRDSKVSISALHCGFDVSKFNGPRDADRKSVLHDFGWPEDSKLVLFAGRLDRSLDFDHPQNHKNSWFALNVARAAVQKDPSIRLLMAGGGDHARPELKRRIGSWGLDREMRLIGVRHDMPRLMRASDVLLFPSRQEGLGMVAVEAQAAGLPVLASTAVPRECVVIADLYEAVSLDRPIEDWVDALLQRMDKPRPPVGICRRAIEASPFSIVNSCRRLEEMYGVERG